MARLSIFSMCRIWIFNQWSDDEWKRRIMVIFTTTTNGDVAYKSGSCLPSYSFENIFPLFYPKRRYMYPSHCLALSFWKRKELRFSSSLSICFMLQVNCKSCKLSFYIQKSPYITQSKGNPNHLLIPSIFLAFCGLMLSPNLGPTKWALWS